MNLPMNWQLVPLGTISTLGPKKPLHLRDSDQPCSFVPMASVEEESGIIHLEQSIEIREGLKRSLTYFNEGDVLFAKVTPCMENGKIAVAKKLLNGRGFGSSEFHVITPGSSLDAEYLRYYLVSEDFRANAAMSMTGAVGLRRVPRAYLQEHLIPLPPLDEQQRIVEVLDDHLSRLDKALVEVESNKSRFSTLSEVLIRNLFPSGLDSNTLGDVCKIVDCEHKTAPKTVTDHAGFSVGTSAIRHGVIDYSKAKPVSTETLQIWTGRARPRPGDVVLTREAPIGESALVPDSPQVCLGQRTVLIQMNLSVFEPEYLHLWLQSPQVRDWMRLHSTGTTVLHLNVADVKRIPLPMPLKLSEQKRLVLQLKDQQSLAREAVSEVPRISRQIKQLRSAILFEAFSGNVSK